MNTFGINLDTRSINLALVLCAVAGTSGGCGTSDTTTTAATPSIDEVRTAAKNDGILSYSLGIQQVTSGVSTDKGVTVPTSDGNSLSVNVFRPDKAGTYPTLVVVTPYGKDQTPADWGPSVRQMYDQDDSSIGSLALSSLTPFEGPDPAYWVSQGYVVVYADLPLPSIFMQQGVIEGADLVEWAGSQPWSNGNVGMIGVSALAIVQYGVAAAHPAHLKAIIPWEGRTDEYRDTAFPGGIPETRFHLRGATIDSAIAAGTFDTVKQQSQLTPSLPLEEVVVPTLICASWSDQGLHTRGSFEAFRKISSTKKWLFTHGGRKWESFYSPEARAYQTKFLDFYLKNIDNGWESTPPVRLAVRETQTSAAARGEQEWPIARTEYQRLYLRSGGQLATSPSAKPMTVPYGAQSDGTAFEMTFDRDTEISGYMSLHLVVSATTATDTDLIVGIHKLDGQQLEQHFFGMDGYFLGVVARGWLRASQRDLDPVLSTDFQPVYKFQGEQKLTPGQKYAVDVAVLPSSTLFHKGDMLRVSIAGRDNINYGRVKYEYVVTSGETVIHSGGVDQSYLQIPVIPAR